METAPSEMKRVLVFGGKTGWIGGLMVDLCKEQGKIIILVMIFTLFPIEDKLICASNLYAQPSIT
jgi:hypothetical protein